MAISDTKPRAIKLSVALPVRFNNDKEPWQRFLAKRKEMQDTDSYAVSLSSEPQTEYRITVLQYQNYNKTHPIQMRFRKKNLFYASWHEIG